MLNYIKKYPISFSKMFLFSLLSSSLITPAFANPSANDVYHYGYSWGGMYRTCLTYKIGGVSKTKAKQEIAIAFKYAKKHIEDRQIFRNLKNASAKVFSQECKDLL